MTVIAPEKAERVSLDLEGMTCASCATRIERKLNRLDGVEATVNYATDQAAVTYDPAAVSVDDLVAAVEAAGYHAVLPGAGVDDGSGRRAQAPPRRRDRAERAARRCSRWCRRCSSTVGSGLPLLLATPVVFWAGWTFHRAAFVNARHGAATMDTLDLGRHAGRLDVVDGRSRRRDRRGHVLRGRGP